MGISTDQRGMEVLHGDKTELKWVNHIGQARYKVPGIVSQEKEDRVIGGPTTGGRKNT